MRAELQQAHEKVGNNQAEFIICLGGEGKF
jgi:hypothetical protein